MSNVDTILISFNPCDSNGNELLLVGRKDERKPVDVINAFQGEEAVELYNKLITPTELMKK